MKKYLIAFLSLFLIKFPALSESGVLLSTMKLVGQIKQEEQQKIKQEDRKIYHRVWNGYGLTRKEIAYLIFESAPAYYINKDKYKNSSGDARYIGVLRSGYTGNELKEIHREAGENRPDDTNFVELNYLGALAGEVLKILSEKGFLTGGDFKEICRKFKFSKPECDGWVKKIASVEPKYKNIDEPNDGLFYKAIAPFSDGVIWTTKTAYGIEVKGAAACLETNHGSAVGELKDDLTITPGVSTGEYCWCQVLEPFVSGWVYVRDYHPNDEVRAKLKDRYHMGEACGYDGDNCSTACPSGILRNETVARMLMEYAKEDE